MMSKAAIYPLALLVLINFASVAQSIALTASIENKTSESNKEVEVLGFEFDTPFPTSGHINSLYRENGPVMAPDAKTIFFSRSNHPDNVGGVEDMEDIWYAEWNEDKGDWSEAKNMGKRFNNVGPNFVNSISVVNGIPIMLLGNQYHKKFGKRMMNGISTSKFLDGEWSDPEKSEIQGFYNYASNTAFFESKEGEILLMSVSQDDTKGGSHTGNRDLYYSLKIDASTWSSPLNLGEINTEGDETAPFLIGDEYLVYSTDGRSGFGGKDLFVCKRLDNTWKNWSEPINLGDVINDHEDNVYFSYCKKRNTAFITRGLYEGDMDIYEFELHIEELLAQNEGTVACGSRRFFHELENVHDLKEIMPSAKCLEFDASESATSASKKMEYLWSYGDYEVGYGVISEHCYDNPGIYLASLTLIDPQSGQHYYEELQLKVEILNDVETEVNENNQAIIGVRESFIADISNKSDAIKDLEFYWDFGDGNYGCGNYSRNEYALAGDYKTKLITSFTYQGEQIKLIKSFDIQVTPY